MKYLNATKSYLMEVLWLSQTGVAATVTGTPTITVKRYNTSTNDFTTLVSAVNMTQDGSTSRWVYELDTTGYTSEADYVAIYSAVVDGLTVLTEEFFRVIEDTNALVKELRVGNQRMDFTIAVSADGVRNVSIGMVDSMTIRTKSDSASDWGSATSTKTLYFWYDVDGNCVAVKEDG